MGNDYDFEHTYKYNFESQISMTINLPKTCYCNGEFITGNLYLKTKPYMQERILISPKATVALKQLYNVNHQESDFDLSTQKENSNTSLEKEINLFAYEINLSNFQGANLLQGVNIPFSLKIPENSFPSCIFDQNTYIRHFLIFNFISIKAKKTAIIIIKNHKYYSESNKLFKTPAICTEEINKHQYGIFNKGSFTASIKLAKNSFRYDETIPFLVEIDCSKLSIGVKSIIVSLNVSQIIKDDLNKSEIKSKKIKEIVSKNIELTKGDKKYIIDDIIKMPSTSDNPKIMYQQLDSDKRKFSEKFKNILLLPTLQSDILNCEYSIKVLFEMDSYFSTNESLEMPIELYENEIIVEKNEDIDLPDYDELIRSQNIKQQNNINNNCDFQQTTFNNNIINQINNYNSNYNYNKDYNENNNDKNNEGNTTKELEDFGAPPTMSQILYNKK